MKRLEELPPSLFHDGESVARDGGCGTWAERGDARAPPLPGGDAGGALQIWQLPEGPRKRLFVAGELSSCRGDVCARS